ncbi:MAG: ABC transporter ATP-binding protein [Actinomycetota bacterium]
MARIVFDHVTKVFDDDVVAVNDLSLEIEDGEFMVLVGPSGCGKTTVLRLLAGLEEVSAGEIRIGDRDVTDLPPKDRDVAMVFQNYALYPQMTVEQNIGFGLRVRNVGREEVAIRVREMAGVLGLERYLHRKPAALSGGQRQRVAVGRAVVRDPQAFLMDEPLSNLDAKLRVQMRAELSALHERLQTTTIFVTHDQVEAMTLGQRVAVMRDGILQQVATPQELYRRPANLFVGAFIGSPPMNLVEAQLNRGRLVFGGLELPVPKTVDLERFEGGTVILGIRPSDFADAAVWGDDSGPSIEVTTTVTEDLGSELNILFTVDAPPVVTEETVASMPEDADPHALIPLIAKAGQSVFSARVDSRTSCRPGERIRLSLDPDRFYFFDVETGQAIEAGRTSPASTQGASFADVAPPRSLDGLD